jgi:NADH-quinone oxidoreductase subunit H
MAFILFYMLIRWTVPRFRFDQLMGLAWKVFIPLALFNLLAVIAVKEAHAIAWWLLPISILLLAAAAVLTSMQPAGPKRRMDLVQ